MSSEEKTNINPNEKIEPKNSENSGNKQDLQVIHENSQEKISSSLIKNKENEKDIDNDSKSNNKDKIDTKKLEGENLEKNEIQTKKNYELNIKNQENQRDKQSESLPNSVSSNDQSIEVYDAKKESKLENSEKTENIFQDYNVPLNFEFTQSLAQDLSLRTKLTRDAIINQVILHIGVFIKIKDELTQRNKERSSQTFEEKEKVINIGIIGGGMMGRIFIDFLSGKKFLDYKINLEVSTRVPENLVHHKYQRIKIFYDNSKIIRDNEIILICTNKHKNKKVFNSIKNETHKSIESNKVIYYL